MQVLTASSQHKLLLLLPPFLECVSRRDDGKNSSEGGGERELHLHTDTCSHSCTQINSHLTGGRNGEGRRVIESKRKKSRGKPEWGRLLTAHEEQTQGYLIILLQ